MFFLSDSQSGFTIVSPVISSAYASLLVLVLALGNSDSIGKHRRRTQSFQKNKKSLFPEGNKDRKYNFCGTTLFAGKPTARPTPTRRLPRNAGNASEDTQAHALSLCPRRPICCPASRFPLSCGKLSVDALAALLPRLWFAVLKLFPLYTKSNCLSRTFFKKFSGSCGQMFSTDAQYSRTTPLTTPMIWA